MIKETCVIDLKLGMILISSALEVICQTRPFNLENGCNKQGKGETKHQLRRQANTSFWQPL